MTAAETVDTPARVPTPTAADRPATGPVGDPVVTALRHRRTWWQRMVLVGNVVIMTVSLTAAGVLAVAARHAGSVARVPLDRSLTPTAAEGGNRVVNILLVGSDSSANLDPDDPVQIGRQGERLADVIILAHIDQRTGQAALLSLPRDLWLPIADTGRSDKINRAFVVAGPSGLIDTIEQRFDVPIHHYVNVDFAGFEGLVDAVGSVDVYFDTPARDWNVNADPPRSQTGFIVDTAGCHALGPREALAYVRSRYYQTRDADGEWQTDPSSDLGRIGRQQDFLQRLLQSAIDNGARNPVVLADLIDTGIKNVVIDSEMSPALLLDLAQDYRGFEPDDLQTFTVPASDDTVGTARVLVPRDADAAAVLALMRGARFDDPDTIAVTVRSDEARGSGSSGSARGSGTADEPGETGLDTVLTRLDGAGFDVDEARPLTSSSVVAPTGGITVAYGPSGRQAAEVVAAALTGRDDGEGEAGTGTSEVAAPAGPTVSAAAVPPGVTFVETSALAPREVVVTVTDPVTPPPGDRLGADVLGPDGALGQSSAGAAGSPITTESPDTAGSAGDAAYCR
ncbi:MAG: LCP family protein [Acidimicrobiales bacterium]